jgi:hypothetical protein
VGRVAIFAMTHFVHQVAGPLHSLSIGLRETGEQTKNTPQRKTLSKMRSIAPAKQTCRATGKLEFVTACVYLRSRQIGLVNAPSPATSHTAKRAHFHPGVSTSHAYS